MPRRASTPPPSRRGIGDVPRMGDLRARADAPRLLLDHATGSTTVALGPNGGALVGRLALAPRDAVCVVIPATGEAAVLYVP
jgi:hypothetical protein